VKLAGSRRSGIGGDGDRRHARGRNPDLDKLDADSGVTGREFRLAEDGRPRADERHGEAIGEHLARGAGLSC